ncbi:hypothetical protein [Cellulophaga baltica]|uniref:Uncharacterized protein n=1 Tax=Cellulophaga baltica 18 TaxID=1348584 RepID=A0AAU8RDR1_9FLAO|nr:hypothetical protein [Cellulophaga baltica]AIZ41603.1 hypothetical protein M666_08465 [Cellulophaga baltica 18]
MSKMLWFRSLLFLLLCSSFQGSYAAVENEAKHDNLDVAVILDQTAVQDRFTINVDALNVLWENTTSSNPDSTVNLHIGSSLNPLENLCICKNQIALLYISSGGFIDLNFDTHQIAYHFHSFP